MGFKPFGNQALAIDNCGHNIIVSAGAGSGKTAVLTERIKRILLSGVNANRLLVLTFTNNAAAEMKERVVKKMIEEPELQDRTSEVDGAYITTFDSFSLSLVKKYHDRVNLSKNISIIDNSVMNVYKRKVLDEIFTKLYTDHNPLIEKLVFDLSTKNDNSIKNWILCSGGIYQTIYTRLDAKEYLDSYLKTYFSDTKVNEIVKEYENLIMKSVQRIKDIMSLVESLDVDIEEIEKVRTVYARILEAYDYNSVRNALNEKLPGPRNKDELVKEYRNMMKKEYDLLKKEAIYPNIEFVKESYLQTKDYVDIIIQIIQELYKRVDEYKRKYEVFEFSDIAKFAYQIVKENDDIRETLKNYFYEILIDEYQDTNDIQEDFVSLIANNNVYMVGDIKQSIYAFRDANPSIFKAKYDNYRNQNGGEKIDLTNNFRSNRAVINTVNKVFGRIMDDKIGNADFINEHAMISSLQDYDGTSIENKIKLVVYPKDEENGMNLQMFYIASDIEKKIKDGIEIYDKDAKKYRKCCYGDFAVLGSRSKYFEDLEKILAYKNIPSDIIKDTDLTNNDTIRFFKNILKLIALDSKNEYGKEFKLAFVAAARSFVINYSDEDIFKYITNETFKESTLYQIINEYALNINKLSLCEIISSLMEKLNIYEKIINVGDVKTNIINLEYLQNMAKSIESIDLTIYDFIEYFENIFENDDKLESKFSSTDPNKVKIMTIHKSKGLEYPIVYFMDNGADFFQSDKESRNRIIFNNKYGIMSAFNIDGVGKTCNRIVYEKNKKLDVISEKIRLLYVALTRPREYMIVIIPDYRESHEPLDGLVPESVRENYSCFADIYNSVSESFPLIEEIDSNMIKITNDYKKPIYKEIDKYFDEVDNKIKYVENKNNSSIITNEHASKTNFKLVTKEQKEIMSFGTKMHEVFESFDFNNPSFDEYSPKEIDAIKAFVDNDINKNISKAKVYKEFEFVYKVEEKKIHGIIDLMVEYDNYIDIVDYKLSHTDDEAYINQLNTYRRYIESRNNKPVNLYLYSISKKEFKKVEKI